MFVEYIGVKPGTRNHKGYFVQQASGYRLMEIHESGWAVICISDSVCHYVDPENLQRSHHTEILMIEEL